MDHITALLARVADGPVHKAAIKLLAPAYSQQEAEAVWTAWAPHLGPPPDHPLARGTLIQDTIIQSLCTPYPTAELAREAANKLVNDIAKAVLTQIFVAHTAEDLSDEEMEVTFRASHSDHTRSHFYLPVQSPCGPRCPTGLALPRITPIGESCRNHERYLSPGHHAPRPTLSAGLAQSFLALIAAIASAIWPAIPAFFPLKGTLHSLPE